MTTEKRIWTIADIEKEIKRIKARYDDYDSRELDNFRENTFLLLK